MLRNPLVSIYNLGVRIAVRLSRRTTRQAFSPVGTLLSQRLAGLAA